MTTAQPDGGAAGGPTVLRMLLGAHLRRLREAQGVSREDAGWEIRSSESKISRMELGRVGFKERDIEDLLTLYGVDDPEERARLMTPGPGGQQPRLVAPLRRRAARLVPVLPRSRGGRLADPDLRGAVRPRACCRPRNTRPAVVQLGHRRAPMEEIDRRVSLRLARQQILTRTDPPQLWAVVDEGALRRPIGGPGVIRGQIEALIEATKLPNVRLQVIPFHAGGHAAAGGSFTILRFPDQDLPDVVYIEQLTSALYLDKRDDVDNYAAAMERLCIEADPPNHTAEILDEILQDHGK